jgi:hypothetical protein
MTFRRLDRENETEARSLFDKDALWSVPNGGFRWEERDGEDFLVEAQAHDVDRAYRPLRDHQTLCAEFAALRLGDADQILDFANRYGSLGLCLVSDEAAHQGESLRYWNHAISEAAVALALLRAARGKSTIELRDWITWAPSQKEPGFLIPILDVRLPGGKRDLHPGMDEPGFYRRLGVRPRDYRAAARFGAHAIIAAWVGQFVMMSLRWNALSERLELQPSPRGLLGMIWVQIARIAEGVADHRLCAAPGCDVVILIGVEAGGHRQSRSTCSERCKKAAQRARLKAEKRAANRNSKRH